MEVSSDVLIHIKKQIERHTKADSNISDVIINYQVKKTDRPKNYLKLNITIK
jgi:hypothetical protein